MFESRFIKRRLAVASLLAVFSGALPAASQECSPANPYVFILFDTSGSMNYSPVCTQAQIDAGQCSFLCPTGDCYVPLQGDDPASRIVQVKEALYTSLENQFSVQLGFATYNQDALQVKAKHWLYQTQGGGPVIPSWGAYPATGAREVFGALWPCDTGSGDNEIGCYPATPADLPDAWELARVRRLSKGGTSFNQSLTFYVRRSTATYRVIYSPMGTAALGAPTITVNVRIDRCTNAGCTALSLIGQQAVTWSLASEFLSYDNGLPNNLGLDRTDPSVQYFTNAANDALATNQCSGWEPNTDSASDPFAGYNLRWPTDTSDPRGSLFYRGDMLPLDWLYDNRQDIQKRLAPSIALGSTVPDFRVSTYLQDLPLPGESFLRLKDEPARPLIAMGSTPFSFSVRAFRLWFEAWAPTAAANDPDWACRGKYLLVLTDDPAGDCMGANACAEADWLRNHYNLKSYAVAYGTSIPQGQPLTCIAQEGGTGSPYYPQSKQELIDVLNAIFTETATP